MPDEARFNPFPGLRPFEAEEDYLFFGRDKQIDELLRRLRTTRFLSVIGTSGSGKSSLIRAGLIPALEGGYMVRAGSSWRVAKFRPGANPIGHLAESLSSPEVLGTIAELADTQKVLIEATLHRSTSGIADAVRQAKIPSQDNLLIVVDQFEELFRFRHSVQQKNSRDEALAFVKLLLEATQQDPRIYVVITMRSDFIGDCMEYPGLPEAVNAGQYLVPRMTRDELRTAITGPIAVGRAQITPRLVLRLLNEVGDDQDLLPVLQHGLMRTWEQWRSRKLPDEPIDIPDYEAVGTMQHALSNHAEQAYADALACGTSIIAQRLFKALTDTYSDPRGVRRPTSVEELIAICDAPESQVLKVIEIFRHPGRSFLMPLPPTPLRSETVVDISHETLMRCWGRLILWAEEERDSAETYARLSQAAKWFEKGTTGLWRDPELELGLRWRNQSDPTAAWARRYDSDFEQAMQFLERSAQERNRIRSAEERSRRRKLREYQWAAGVLALLLVMTGLLFHMARVQKARAERYSQLAKGAVDQMLSSAGQQQARVVADVPELESFRRELLQKADAFYAAFALQDPTDSQVRIEMARAHFRLGDINRLLEKNDLAAFQYQQAINSFNDLIKKYPQQPELRRELAYSYNWLGQTLQVIPAKRSGAEQAYDNALMTQGQLVREHPEANDYRREMARSYYNRGIVRFNSRKNDQAEADFKNAIQLLEPLASGAKDPGVSQELARAYNNLGNLLRFEDRADQANSFLQRALVIHQDLTSRFPDNREYQFELANFYSNLALLAAEQNNSTVARQYNQQSLAVLQRLARPTTSVSIELAKVYNLAAQVSEEKGPEAVEQECRKSLAILEQLTSDPRVRGQPELQGLYRDLGYDYLELAQMHLHRNSFKEAQQAMENLSRLMPQLSDAESSSLKESYAKLEKEMRSRTYNGK